MCGVKFGVNSSGVFFGIVVIIVFSLFGEMYLKLKFFLVMVFRMVGCVLVFIV